MIEVEHLFMYLRVICVSFFVSSLLVSFFFCFVFFFFLLGFVTLLINFRCSFWNRLTDKGASRVVLVVKNLPANAGDMGDAGLIPGWGSSPGGGHGNPLQYSCLENPMDRGAWQAAVHRAAKSWTLLKQLSTHPRTDKENKQGLPVEWGKGERQGSGVG